MYGHSLLSYSKSHSCCVSKYFLTISTTSNHLLDLPRLRSLTISEGCFSKTTGLIINGLGCLEYVKIENECFGSKRSLTNCCCQITNCPNLLDLDIGSKCFTEYESFNISKVNSLQSITFGSNAFVRSDCVLKSKGIICGIKDYYLGILSNRLAFTESGEVF